MSKCITVNVKKCLACKSCEIACALIHSKSQVVEEVITESPLPQARVKVEGVGEFSVPMQCRHCEDAPCVAICPTYAIRRHKANGPVLIERDKCIGCKYCLMVCPFGVIDITRDGKAVAKCDLCLENTKVGKDPACVSACPTHALKYEDASEMVKKHRKDAAIKASVVGKDDESE